MTTKSISSRLLIATAVLAFCPAVSQSAPAPPPLHPTLQYQASWLGNSFGEPNKWVQKDALGLAVSSDGTCYLPSSWDEAGKGIGIYKDGQAIGKCERISVGDGGIAVDDKYVYSPTPVKVNGKAVTRVRRWTVDGAGAPLPGPGGTDEFDHDFGAWVGGICAYRGEVFVQDAAENKIRIFDRETLAEKRSFDCTNPFRLAVDKAGLLWVLERSNDFDPRHPQARLVQFTVDGKPTGKSIGGIDGATAIAAGPNGTLLVAGPDNQVLEWDVRGGPMVGDQPVVENRFGVKGGVFAGPVPGKMGPDRLLGLVGVGADDAGNIYTAGRSYASGGSFDLRKFDKSGKLVWQLYNQGFTDCAAVDPASDGQDVYTRAEHFHFDPAQPAGKQWTWVGYTLNPANDDGRMDIGGFSWSSPMLRRLHGRLYMYEHPGPYIGVFRQESGEVFAPSAAIDLAPMWMIPAPPTNDHYKELNWPANQPTPRVRWDWRDLNGNGKVKPGEFETYPQMLNEVEFISSSWVDGLGNIWLSGSSSGTRTMWELPIDGFDAHDNPIYQLSRLVKVALPAEFKQIERVVYSRETDTMYLSGETRALPKELHWGSIGTEVIRYDHWSTPQRAVRWRIQVPPGKLGDDTFFPCLAIAGDKVFLMQRYWSRIWTYDANSGSYLGSITTTPAIGTSGWCDMDNGVSAFLRKDGHYLIFAEDDYRPKIRVYDVPPQAWTPQTAPPAGE